MFDCLSIIPPHILPSSAASVRRTALFGNHCSTTRCWKDPNLTNFSKSVSWCSVIEILLWWKCLVNNFFFVPFFFFWVIPTKDFQLPNYFFSLFCFSFFLKLYSSESISPYEFILPFFYLSFVCSRLFLVFPGTFILSFCFSFSLSSLILLSMPLIFSPLSIISFCYLFVGIHFSSFPSLQGSRR